MQIILLITKDVEGLERQVRLRLLPIQGLYGYYFKILIIYFDLCFLILGQNSAKVSYV